MSASKKILIIVLSLFLIGLVVFGIFSRGGEDKNDIEDGVDYTDSVITDNGDLFDDNGIFNNDEKEDVQREDSDDVASEIDDLEKKIEEVLRLFDPIEEDIDL